MTAVLAGAAGLFAQGPHHGGGMDDLWPDSLNTVEVTGVVIIDSTTFHPGYYLDENGDGIADYHLSFGPWWHRSDTDAIRPADGETVTIVGMIEETTMMFATLHVFEINGMAWREPVGYGMHGWNGDPFWNDLTDTLMVTGTVLVDTTYFYPHYFLDTDGESIPEYQLGFGPPWYHPDNGAVRPLDGETITVMGSLHTSMMSGFDMLSVYTINGLSWRPLDQFAPWAGMWVYRDHQEDTFAYCVTDSANWIRFQPGHSGGMMGGMWPDSSFVQFWQIHPDSLPGEHDSEHFSGFYLNMHDPQGRGMMDGRFGGMHGMMHFQKEHEFRFRYHDEDLAHMGRSEDEISVHRWDESAQAWQAVSGTTVNTQDNTVSFSSSDLAKYYAISAQASVTGIEASVAGAVPSQFVLQQNFPNPFNPSTNIQFTLPVQAHVQLSVYNLLGQRIATLVNGNKTAGSHTVQWHGGDNSGSPVSSGIYLLRFEAGEQVRVRRIALMK
jgi:hypothetical protein